jgi:hypothetical protein
MNPITITAVVDEDHRLTVKLPAEIPVGPVEVTIRPLEAAAPHPETKVPSQPLTREAARAKLLAGGLLSTGYHAPEGTVPLTPEEILELGRLYASPRTTSEMIDEDRGPH